MIQVMRRGKDTWDVLRVTSLWSDEGGAHEYETIGRVIGDGRMYYVDLPLWHADGFEWKRQTRAYAIPRGAFRAITTGRAAKEGEKVKQ